MRIDSLPSPGFLSAGLDLRRAAAAAISSVEINAALSGGKSVHATQLGRFFTACYEAIDGLRDTTSGEWVAVNVADNLPSIVRVTLDIPLEPGTQPPASRFVLTPTRAVTKVEYKGPYIDLTVATPFLAGESATLAYTEVLDGNGDSDVRYENGVTLPSRSLAVVNGVGAY